MKEITLKELEEWYYKKLSGRFKKQHKILTKIFKLTEREVAETINSLQAWDKIAKTDEERKLDEKNISIMERFIEKVTEGIKEIKIPTVHNEITYQTSYDFCEDVKKVYKIYNEQGRKAIPRFGKKFNTELKEIDFHLRKLGDYAGKVSKFLRSDYSEGKDAEDLLARVPRLENDIERLGNSKTTIDDMEIKFENMKKDLKKYEDDLYALSQDPDLVEFEKLVMSEQKDHQDFRGELKFRKVLKKMRKMMEKDSIIVRDITENDIRPYIKDAVLTILDEGPKLPNLKPVLIKTRILLEEDENPLMIKADLRKRVIENINEIVTDSCLESTIADMISKSKKKDELQKTIDEKGISAQRKELKEKLAILTADAEHFENDLNRQRREYKDLLTKVGNDRNSLQDSVKKETGNEVKIKVIIPT